MRRLASFRYGRTHCESFSNKRLTNVSAISLNKAVAGHELQACHPSLVEGYIVCARNQVLQTRASAHAEFALDGHRP